MTTAAIHLVLFLKRKHPVKQNNSIMRKQNTDATLIIRHQRASVIAYV